MLRKASTILVSISLISLAAGCGGTKTSTDDPAGTASGGSETDPDGEAATPEAPEEPGEPEEPEAPELDGAIAQVREFIGSLDVDKSVNGWKMKLKKPPMLEFTAGRSYFWRLKTNQGGLKLRFMPDVAPMHVSSCIYLTELGFYDDLTFHRVMSSPRQPFMAQGGCPRGNGRGSPGYQFGGEFDPDVRHSERGVLSTANTGPGTDGSQFFITFVPTPHLNDKHTIYGRLVDGWDALAAIQQLGSPGGSTQKPIIIEQATISVE